MEYKQTGVHFDVILSQICIVKAFFVVMNSSRALQSSSCDLVTVARIRNGRGHFHQLTTDGELDASPALSERVLRVTTAN